MTFEAPDKMTEINRQAWSAHRYDAWTSKFGSAEAEAERIIANPKHIIRRTLPYFGTISGKRICNIQGSHGRLAVALALLGAEVQVIDFSQENRRFALELAKAANVSIEYAVCDVMAADDLDMPFKFDTLVLELGILHYHQDIEQFFSIMRHLVADKGKLVLNEFHPVQRKVFWPEGPRNYFHEDLVEADVPNPNIGGASLGKCHYRFWTMADILTATINSGFTISILDEHPDWTDPNIPGSFTLVAHA